ncbi:hypothetical protein EZJ43_12805 [Pedobacter changchengzhani]|uniref:Lipoprotein n=1 Tax=Pedobacter changchengzhani TaxID=2529274 RepID=A0A4R5MK85_9SPHI|nr:hypothetical protein [Pedobacter changchengzhani]TDG35499.1 hypothetical protein EZJ43_12805 [Pedobacter changchengzhani]
MKKIFTILSLVLVCLLFTACKKNSLKNLTNIGYGTSFGKCIGYCKTNLEVTSAQLSFSKSSNDGRLPKKDCQKTFTASEFEALKALFNDAKITSLPAVIGCPDCADGGAEWISVVIDGKEYKVTFEYGNAPDELKAAVLKLRTLKDGFKDCE